MLKILIMLYIIISPINLNTFSISLTIAGMPLLAWILYPLYIFLLISFAWDLVTGGNAPWNLMLFYIALLTTIVYSFMQGISWRLVFMNSLYYSLPVMLYHGVMRFKPKTIIHTELLINCSVAICGVLALLFISRSYLIMSQLGDMERSSTAIDGGLGLVGVALGFYYMMSDNLFRFNNSKYIVIILGILIVISGASRSRIATMIVIITMFLLFGYMQDKIQKKNLLRIFAFLALGALCVYLFFPSIVNDILEKVLSRFTTLGTDNSSLYRNFERNTQLEYFLNKPVFGTGWGGMKDVLVKDTWGNSQEIHNHNMYSSLLANGGLIYTIPYALWFMPLLWNEIKLIKKDTYAPVNVILIVTAGIMGIGSAGFVKHSMTIGMIVVYLNMRKRRILLNEQKDSSSDLSQAN